VDKALYEALPQEDQEYLSQNGVEMFNQKQGEEHQTFIQAHVQLDTGEYVSRENYDTLNAEDQAYLMQHGVAGFNERVGQVDLQNYVELDTGEYVSRTEYNKLSSEDQAYLRQYGLDKFNEKAEQLALQNFVQLDTGEHVDAQAFYGLSEEDQAYLKQYGINAFGARIQDFEYDESLANAWQEFVPASDVGYGEGQLHPYQVVDRLIEIGASDAVIYTYMQQFPEAHRGANAYRFSRRVNEILNTLAGSSDTEQFTTLTGLGYIPEG
ncbi:unnamed protein product, partial [marine sediment metagenome]